MGRPARDLPAAVLVPRIRDRVKQVRLLSRSLARELGDLEHVLGVEDTIGSYTVAPGREIGDEVTEFLRLARSQYPKQELTITVRAHPGREDVPDERDSSV